MSYKIILTDNFKKESKKLIKKYKSLKSELEQFGIQLSEKPTSGTALGNNLYKIRLTISSKGKGKSGGARVITFVKVVNEIVYLVSIYDKKEYENLSKLELIKLLKKAGLS